MYGTLQLGANQERSEVVQGMAGEQVLFGIAWLNLFVYVMLRFGMVEAEV